MPPPSNIRSASIVPKVPTTPDEYDRLFRAALNIEKEDDLSLGLDCMCEKNDPNCPECWLGKPHWSGIVLPPTETQSEFERDVRNRFDECLELLLRKHADYGPANIANAPGGAMNGLQVRMHDKLARVNHLLAGNKVPNNESLRDTFLDLANYSVIALMVLDDVWPTE
jgi:hypothetical protein